MAYVERMARLPLWLILRRRTAQVTWWYERHNSVATCFLGTPAANISITFLSCVFVDGLSVGMR